jgi:enoyl-CoA hydratase/carnithine racemase
MDYTQILYEVEDHIATITLNRPEQLNAFTTTMMREMIDAFDRVDADDDVRAVIVTGAGRGFCAGADLSAGGATFAKGGSDEDTPADIPRDGGGMVSLRVFECLKPVIAAINGPAVGVGITMTLPMDIRLASNTAKIGFVFVRRGIVPEACSSWFLPRVVGVSKALEWCYSGRVFTADEALEGGLVRSIHEPDELLPAARSIAAEIVENASPVSVALTRRMLWSMLTTDHPMEAHRVDSRAILHRGRSADASAGVESFLAKRSPVFTDKVSEGLPDVFLEPSSRKFS